MKANERLAKRAILVVLAVIAVAFVAAGSARADVPPPPAGSGWCGQAAGTCDSSLNYVECSDASIWVIDQSWDADGFGEAMCGGDYAVLTAPSTPIDGGDGAPAAGEDVGLGSDPNIAPDPTQYSTEVRCSDGSIWAVPSGVDFVCPAA